MTRGCLHRVSLAAAGLLMLGCASSAPNMPTSSWEIDHVVHDGHRRAFAVVAPRATGAPLPVVVVLHGVWASGRSIARWSGFDRLAVERGFVAVFPNGTSVFGLFRHWNGGVCCGQAADKNLDDTGLLLAIVDRVATRFPIDPGRIYVVGHSNGGMLAERFAHRFPERTAGLAIVSGTLGGDPGGPDGPAVPSLMVHGLGDTTLPFDGGPLRGRHGAPDIPPTLHAIGKLLNHNGCVGGETASRSSDLDGSLVLEIWECPGAPVGLMTLVDWGHNWPGGRFLERLPVEDPLSQLDLASRIWQFFDALP